jgi:hypothetical protein
MKYEIIFITSLGRIKSKVVEYSEEEYIKAIEQFEKLVNCGESFTFVEWAGNAIVLSKNILQSCIISIEEIKE